MTDPPPGSALAAALAKVQAKIPALPKGRHVDVAGKEGKRGYAYDYAELDAVTAVILPLLGENGLAFTCDPGADDQGRLVLDYSLLHEGGEIRERQFPLWLVLPDRYTAQTVGGLITYFRRYCLCAVTGLAPGGEDDDAAGAVAEGDADPQSAGEAFAAATPAPRRGSAGQDAAAALKAAERRQQQRGDSVRAGHRDEDQPPEDQPGTIDDLQMRGIQARFRGILTREDLEQRYELAYAERFTQRPLDGPAKDHRSLANLSYAEAALLKDDLRGKTRDDLVDGLLDDAGAS